MLVQLDPTRDLLLNRVSGALSREIHTEIAYNFLLIHKEGGLEPYLSRMYEVGLGMTSTHMGINDRIWVSPEGYFWPRVFNAVVADDLEARLPVKLEKDLINMHVKLKLKENLLNETWAYGLKWIEARRTFKPYRLDKAIALLEESTSPENRQAAHAARIRS